MRVGVVLGAAFVAVASASCARGTSSVDELSENVPLPRGISPCEDVFGPDKVIDPKTFGEACSRGDEMVVPRPVELRCTDQRVLLWNDFAWGYEGQPMTMLDTDVPEAEQELPYDEAVECLREAPTADR